MNPARLLFPALRWHPGHGFRPGPREREKALELGVGGFIVFGGPAEEVSATVAELREAAGRPLLFGADLERGAGQQFEGCTQLPPAAALGALDDLEVCWRAGELTAREACSLGVGWIYAPVADLANEPRNPIVGTRAFGADPAAVGRRVAAWIQGCLAGGGLPCVKHFPGHGRTLEDSHAALPVVDASPAEVARDLVPFAAAVEAGVPSVMTGHLVVPALDLSGRPATRSPEMVEGLLRGRLGFDGIVVTDALVMAGASEGVADEGEAAVESVAAGVDALLYPQDLDAVAHGLRRAVETGRLTRDRVAEAAARLDAAARRVAGGNRSLAFRGSAVPAGSAAPDPRREDREWAEGVARDSLRWMGPELRLSGGPGPLELVVVDDDLGGPFPPPSRDVLARELEARSVRVRVVDAGHGGECAIPEEDRGRRWLAVFCDTRAWKGRAGLSSESRRAATRWGMGAEGILLFAHPRTAAGLPLRSPTLCAWGGEAVMQRAVAETLARLLNR